MLIPSHTGTACATSSRRRSWRRGSCSRSTCTTTSCRGCRPPSSAARPTYSSPTSAGQSNEIESRIKELIMRKQLLVCFLSSFVHDQICYILITSSFLSLTRMLCFSSLSHICSIFVQEPNRVVSGAALSANVSRDIQGWWNVQIK